MDLTRRIQSAPAWGGLDASLFRTGGLIHVLEPGKPAVSFSRMLDTLEAELAAGRVAAPSTGSRGGEVHGRISEAWAFVASQLFRSRESQQEGMSLPAVVNPIRPHL